MRICKGGDTAAASPNSSGMRKTYVINATTSACYFSSLASAETFASANGGTVKQTSPAFYDRKTGHNSGLFRVAFAA